MSKGFRTACAVIVAAFVVSYVSAAFVWLDGLWPLHVAVADRGCWVFMTAVVALAIAFPIGAMRDGAI